MGDFTFKRMVRGMFPEISAFTAGGTLEEGDLATLNASSQLIKVTNASTAEDLYLVLQAAVATDTDVAAIDLDQDTVIEGVQSGTLGDAGDVVGIDVTGGNITVEAVGAGAPSQFRIVRIEDATGQVVQVRRNFTIGATS